jgi:transcriptional regulator with XRE-family HTH domain
MSSERDAFGPNLRRLRMQQGISIDEIAAATKVSADLWHGLEQNNLKKWPTGIYARAYVRAYALEIGADPETTVDEFCRCFPAGDRRAGRVVREQAALIGHDLRWKDDLAHIDNDRRAEPSDRDVPHVAFTKAGRMIAALADAVAVVAVSAAVASILPIGWAAAGAACAFAYHAGALVALGSTPGVWAIETYLSTQHPTERREGTPRFVRLVRGSERVKA